VFFADFSGDFWLKLYPGRGTMHCPRCRWQWVTAMSRPRIDIRTGLPAGLVGAFGRGLAPGPSETGSSTSAPSRARFRPPSERTPSLRSPGLSRHPVADSRGRRCAPSGSAYSCQEVPTRAAPNTPTGAARCAGADDRGRMHVGTVSTTNGLAATSSFVSRLNSATACPSSERSLGPLAALCR